MKIDTITMEITRDGNKLSSVNVIMPTWNRVGNDNKIYTSIPFLGLHTYGLDENDADIAIKEAFECFCIASEKHGLGLEDELTFMGWKLVEKPDINHSFLNISSEVQAFDSVMETGDTRALSLSL